MKGYVLFQVGEPWSRNADEQPVILHTQTPEVECLKIVFKGDLFSFANRRLPKKNR
jgi:hypothetical protein